MAQNSATVLVEGNVVKSKRNVGTFTGSDGAPVTYDYISAKVITPEFDSVEVRFPSDQSIPVPLRDEVVRLTLEARASMGTLKLTVQAVEPALAPISAVA